MRIAPPAQVKDSRHEERDLRADASTAGSPISVSSQLPVPSKRVPPREVELLWDRPGLCSSAPSNMLALRAQYLGTFVPVVMADSTLYVERSIPTERVVAIRDGVQHVKAQVERALGLESATPTIFLYPSVEALRKYACVNSSAVAYYDGAIHLVAVPQNFEPILSLKHEYVHHALISNGITRPIWLQEGAAMITSGEFEWGLRPWSWKDHPLSMQQMVRAFPNTANEAFAQAYYGQAFAMVRFLDRLCLGEANCTLRTLVGALKSGRATPDTLFDWAVSERGSDLIRTSGLPLWDDYIIHQDFAPATKRALLQRAQ
jgi:hypothetical protein